MIGAITVVGNDLKFTHLKVIGFGTKAGRECFVLVIHPPQPDVRGADAFGNVLVEDCIFADPAPENTDGVTVVSVIGSPQRALTNTVIRGCTVRGLQPYFPISQAFSALDVENCTVSDCGTPVYFEPARVWGDNVGPVLIRSNKFLNVTVGVQFLFHAEAQFDSLTMLDNEIVLTGSYGAAFAACDTCDTGQSGSITNVVALNNIVRYADWSPRPQNSDVGLHYSDIHNAVFGNNVIALGTRDALRVRECPSGYIPAPVQPESCDFAVYPPPPPPRFPACLDFLPPKYHRAWFNNRDLDGRLLIVRYSSFGSDGLAWQQQWP